MAYIPTEWETGDVITAEKLNNMEQGIVGLQPVQVNGGEWTFDSVYSEFQCDTGLSVDDAVGYIKEGRSVVINYPALSDSGTTIYESGSVVLFPDMSQGYNFGVLPLVINPAVASHYSNIMESEKQEDRKLIYLAVRKTN